MSSKASAALLQDAHLDRTKEKTLFKPSVLCQLCHRVGWFGGIEARATTSGTLFSVSSQPKRCEAPRKGAKSENAARSQRRKGLLLALSHPRGTRRPSLVLFHVKRQGK